MHCYGFLTRNFLSRQKWPKNAFWGGMGSKCKILFTGPPKGTSLHETTSFDTKVPACDRNCFFLFSDPFLTLPEFLSSGATYYTHNSELRLGTVALPHGV